MDGDVGVDVEELGIGRPDVDVAEGVETRSTRLASLGHGRLRRHLPPRFAARAVHAAADLHSVDDEATGRWRRSDLDDAAFIEQI